ncbi:MAG: NUDIX hydrolase [Dehalococcoidales bacterium]|nr:NUDIX hydrolase [Dehalococcoidales bacterium]
MKYCPMCGTPLAISFVAGRERPVCSSCSFVGYRNPAPIGLLVATKDGKMLLLRRSIDPLRGFWAPPTGYVEIDESVEEAVVRETKEETNVDVAVGGLFGVYSRSNIGVLMIAYYGKVIGGEALPLDDAEEVGYFGRDELPDQPSEYGGTAIDAWFADVLEDVFVRFREGRI